MRSVVVVGAPVKPANAVPPPPAYGWSPSPFRGGFEAGGSFSDLGDMQSPRLDPVD